jgi:hypothetical protein
LQLQRTEDALLEAQTRLEQLAEMKVALVQWQEQVKGTSGAAALDPLERWWLMSLVSQAVGLNLGWQSLLDSIPPPEAVEEEYIPWVEQVIITIEVESEAIATQIKELDRQSEILQSEWQLALQDSDGLAATLMVEQLSDMGPGLRQSRSIFSAALVGGMLGILLWGVIALFKINWRSES